MGEASREPALGGGDSGEGRGKAGGEDDGEEEGCWRGKAECVVVG